jgi:DNA-binding NarL/FixJ family response regulator
LLLKPSIEQFFQQVVQRTMSVVRSGNGSFATGDHLEYQTAPRTLLRLTSVQLSVAADVVAGYSHGEIADRLGLTERAVSEIFSSTLESLSVSNPLELMLFASYHHLFDRRPDTPPHE